MTDPEPIFPALALVPLAPSDALLRPFYECPPEELGLAWQAMHLVAAVELKKRGVPPVEHVAEGEWCWVRFDSLNGPTGWMPARRDGADWQSLGWRTPNVIEFGPKIELPTVEMISVQDAWEAAGGNPGIKAKRADLAVTLALLDKVCDDADDGQDAAAAKPPTWDAVRDQLAMYLLSLGVGGSPAWWKRNIDKLASEGAMKALREALEALPASERPPRAGVHLPGSAEAVGIASADAPRDPARLSKELVRLADILRDCNRLVSKSGLAELVMREAAAALDQRMGAAPQAAAQAGQAWQLIGASGPEEYAEFLRWVAAGKPALAQTSLPGDEMVNRFLGWPLPQDFKPDGGVWFAPSRHSADAPAPYAGQVVSWPSGTNLLNAIQARAMLQHVLAPKHGLLTRDSNEQA